MEGQSPRHDPPPGPQSPRPGGTPPPPTGQGPQSPGPQSPGAPPPGPQPPTYQEQPSWQQQYGPPHPGGTNGAAIAALVLGLIGVLFGVLLGFFVFTAIIAIILGIVGIVFGVMGRRRAADPRVGRKGMATTGLVLSILTIIGSLFWLVIIGIAFNELSQSGENIENLDQQELQEQLEEQLNQ